jgi:hypothetical protein
VVHNNRFERSRAASWALLVIEYQTLALASGRNRSVTVATLGENNVGGVAVQFAVGEVVDNSEHCADATGYAIRDLAATLKGSLAQRKRSASNNCFERAQAVSDGTVSLR